MAAYSFGSAPLRGLTRRELEVVSAVAWGMTNVQVGGLLSISARTVECHLGRIYAKLHLNTRNQLLASLSQQRGPADRHPMTVNLTNQEMAVATAAAAGLNNRQVARTLFISPKTVEFHLAKVYAKLGIASRRQLPALIGHLPGTPAGPGVAVDS